MRLAPPRLILITDHALAGEQLLARVSACLRAARPGSVAVQLRDKHLSTRRRIDLGLALADACRSSGQYLVVNERVDVAVLLGADGLHLPESSLTPGEVRSLAPQLWLSAACHGTSPKGALDVDAWLLSPVVSPRKGRPALGAGGLAELCARLGAMARGRAAPAVYALGGVDAESAQACLAHGAAGVAVIGAALDGRAIEPLLAALDIAR